MRTCTSGASPLSATPAVTCHLPLGRSGLCAQTFYGHKNACNSIAFKPTGEQVVSTDADGTVRIWDTRKVAEIVCIAASQVRHRPSTPRRALLHLISPELARARSTRQTRPASTRRERSSPSRAMTPSSGASAARVRMSPHDSAACVRMTLLVISMRSCPISWHATARGQQFPAGHVLLA